MTEDQLMRMGDTFTINIYPLPHQDPRTIAEEANRLVRNNKRGRRSQSTLGAR
jgi:hypothetical protein